MEWRTAIFPKALLICSPLSCHFWGHFVAPPGVRAVPQYSTYGDLKGPIFVKHLMQAQRLPVNTTGALIFVRIRTGKRVGAEGEGMRRRDWGKREREKKRALLALYKHMSNVLLHPSIRQKTSVHDKTNTQQRPHALTTRTYHTTFAGSHYAPL